MPDVLTKVLMIAAGGAVGSVARFVLGHLVQRGLGDGFPWGVLAVNVIGCLTIGVIAAFIAGSPEAREAWRLAVIVGLLGGFTTFSAFSLDALELASDGRWLHAGAYVLATNALCLVMTWAGFRAAQPWFPA